MPARRPSAAPAPTPAEYGNPDLASSKSSTVGPASRIVVAGLVSTGGTARLGSAADMVQG